MAMNAEQKERVKTGFDYFDKNKDGTIDKKELKDALQKLGDFSEMEVSAILNEADADRSGTIDFDEFCKYVAPRLLKVPPPVATVREAFDKYDKNRDGYLGADEVVHLAEDLGFGRVSMQQAKNMISIVDADNDGRIDFDEFKRLVINK